MNDRLIAQNNAERIAISRRIAKRYMRRHKDWFAGMFCEDELVNVAFVAIVERDPYFNHAVSMEYFRLRCASSAIISYVAVAKCPVHFRARLYGKNLIGKSLRLQAAELEQDNYNGLPEEIESAAAATHSECSALFQKAVVDAVRSEMGIFASLSENNLQLVRYLLQEDHGERLAKSKREIQREQSILNARRGYWLKQFKGNRVFASAFDYVLE